MAMLTDESTHVVDDTELRERAVKQLKKRRDFYGHVLMYVMVNGLLVVVWLLTMRGGFFWPAFPMAGWGVGLVGHAWDVWHGDDFAEEQIRREMARLERGP